MKENPDWALYRTLLAVLDEGSLSGAARALGLTQPTAARHVDALESLLGGDLFIRSQRGLEPTDLALSLRAQARIMAQSADALLRIAVGSKGSVSGAVRITASDIVGVEHLPPLLTALRREHPALVIELSLSDRVSDLLLREADIAIRMTEPTQTALLARRLRPIELGFFAHRDYLAGAGDPVSLGDLPHYDLIGYDVATPSLRAMTAMMPMLDRGKFAFRADSNLAQLAAIRAGFGIGLCQVTIAKRDNALVRVLPSVGLSLPLWIVMHEDLKTDLRYRVVFDAMVRGLTTSSAPATVQ